MRISLIILFLTYLTGFGQNYIRQLQSSEVALFDFNDPDVTPEKSFDFFDHYGIDLREFGHFVTLEDVPLRSKPEFNSGHYDVYIPAGSTIKVYKYFQSQDFYAIQYKEFWGFIPATTIKPKSSPARKLHISEVDIPPILISAPELNYPSSAKLRKIEGTILIRIHINIKGEVVVAELVDGIPGLNQEALTFAKRLKFKPALMQGIPVEVFANFPVEFTLPEKE
ncbi:MAG: energy transducer TonB [Bacteroidales bacterium]